MEETVVLSPLEILLLNYKDLTQDQELLESLDYVTLMNLCQSSTSLRERCQESGFISLITPSVPVTVAVLGKFLTISLLNC